MKHSRSYSQYQRGNWIGRLWRGLLLTSSLLFLVGCQSYVPKTISLDPDCPKWNTDEWISFYYMTELAKAIVENNAFEEEDLRLPDIMPGVLATGALLQHCFPEQFEAYDEAANEPALVPTPRRNHFKPTFGGKAYQIDV